METSLNKTEPERKKGIFRQEYAEAVGDADEKIIRSLIPIVLDFLGYPVWYFKPHHLNANGPDFDGILKGSLKRVIIEVSNFAMYFKDTSKGSFIDLKKAIEMEKAAGPADYKIHIISFIKCYKPNAKKYLEDHDWHLVELGFQVQTEQYYVSMLDKGYPIILENYEDHLIIPVLTDAIENIVSPIYVVLKSTALRHVVYPIDEPFDLDYLLKQDEVFDELYLESLLNSAFGFLHDSSLDDELDDLIRGLPTNS